MIDNNQRTLEETIALINKEIESSITQFRVNAEELNNAFGFVAYTDGGYRAKMHYRHSPPACGGSGVFGYIFANQHPKVGHGCVGFNPTNVGIIYKDQMNKFIATKDNKFIEPTTVTPLCYIAVRDGSENYTTNNIGELMATLQALKIAKELNNINYVFIRADSEYVLNCLNSWIPNWIENNWRNSRNEPVKNKEILQELWDLYTSLQEQGKQIVLSWIKGHSDSIGNKFADQYATEGMVACNNHVTLPSYRAIAPKDMWAPKVDTPGLLSENLILISNETIKHTLTIKDKDYTFYSQGSFGKDKDDYTKTGSDKCYSVVAMNRPIDILESVITLCKNIKSFNGLTTYIGRLDEFFRPSNYSEMMDVGLIFLRRSYKNEFTLSSGKKILEELTPIKHGDRLNMQFRFIEELLYKYLDNSLDKKYLLMDITDLVYKQEQAKKGIKIVIDPTIDKYIDIPIEFPNTSTNKLRLTIGIDTPKLRILKRFADIDTRIKVLYWFESEKVIRYSLILETNEGTGIWISIYSNQLYLNVE